MDFKMSKCGFEIGTDVNINGKLWFDLEKYVD